ncbi:hypothetical protein DH2020_026940 [Rehmannia glutinosa]|uniref:Reverse transcriptase n=1 Tax=Rehmannia glutinosa TaxID=99300 RepID=A0ABR0VVJ4_REHGL
MARTIEKSITHLISDMMVGLKSYLNVKPIRDLEIELDRVLCYEECYWKQRAHNDWLRAGDINIKHFHSKATSRKHRNWIHGDWLLEAHLIAGEIQKYFAELFTSSNPIGLDMENIVNSINSTIPPDLGASLNELFIEDEVKKALSSMRATKAPGPDGFHPIFFQKNWDLIGTDLIDIVLGILNHGKFVRAFNATTIVMIPKVAQPSKVEDFQPISLCNVTYKVVTKVLTNRLKSVLTICDTPWIPRPASF